MAGTRFTEITEEQFLTASKRGAMAALREPRAVKARYDSRDKKIAVVFASGLELRFSPRMVQGLETARVSDLRRIEISPSGQGIHFPAIDADVFSSGIALGQDWLACVDGIS